MGLRNADTERQPLIAELCRVGSLLVHRWLRRALAFVSAVSRNENRLHCLLETFPSPTLLIDSKSRLRAANRDAERMLGYRRDELRGKSLSEVCRLGDVSSDQCAKGCDATCRRRDGSELPVEFRLTRLPPGEGSFNVISLRDVQRERACEKALRLLAAELASSRRDSEELAYIASHDLREPVRTMSSFLALFGKRMQGKLDTDAAEFLAFAQQGASRLAQLVDGLLLYSRAGRTGPALRPAIAVDKIVDKALALNARALGDVSVARDPLPTLETDPEWLTRIFSEIFSNCAKFRGAEPLKIRLEARRHPDMWEFRVQDNGTGFDMSQAERVFGIFQRLETEAKGAGVGLATVRKLIARLGGKVWVQSAPGKGSTFFFTLPSSPQSP